MNSRGHILESSQNSRDTIAENSVFEKMAHLSTDTYIICIIYFPNICEYPMGYPFLHGTIIVIRLYIYTIYVSKYVYLGYTWGTPTELNTRDHSKMWYTCTDYTGYPLAIITRPNKSVLDITLYGHIRSWHSEAA